jgi:hypothetical protein
MNKKLSLASQMALAIASFSVLTTISTPSYATDIAQTEVPVAQADSQDDDAEVQTELSTGISERILERVAREGNTTTTDLRIVSARRQTWVNGCLGLTNSSRGCTEALVPGWLVVLANSEQAWVYRSNATGTVVLLDEVATTTYAEYHAMQVAAVRQSTSLEMEHTEVEHTEVESAVVEHAEVEHSTVETQQTEVVNTEVELSQTVRTTVLQAIAQRTQLSVSSLQVVEVESRTWSDGCLGLSNGENCTQAEVAGFLVVVTDGQQMWVYRTNHSGSIVALDVAASTMRTAQLQARSTQISFTDVSSSYWASSFIAELAALDILKGYPDGTYRPENPVTRAEFAAIIRHAFEMSNIRSATTFRDVNQRYWAYSAIEKAYEMGFLGAVNGNTFQPRANLTRSDVLFALARGLRLSSHGSVDSYLAIYRDVNLSVSESQMFLAALTEKNIVVNYPQVDMLHLDRVATRAEVAAFVYQALVSLGQVEKISSPYIVQNPVETRADSPTAQPSHSRRQHCNQGIGNSAEGCDPGRSMPHGGSNDETGRRPNG